MTRMTVQGVGHEPLGDYQIKETRRDGEFFLGSLHFSFPAYQTSKLFSPWVGRKGKPKEDIEYIPNMASLPKHAHN